MPDFTFGFIFILLYIVSTVIGKLIRIKVERLFFIVVVSIIFTISLWGASIIGNTFLFTNIILLSFVFAIATLFITYLIGNLLSTKIYLDKSYVKFDRSSFYFITVIVLGWLIGFVYNLNLPFDIIISYELYFLSVLVGLLTGSEISIELIKKSGKSSMLSILTSILGSIIAGFLCSFILNINLKISFAIAMGMGWYSFAGPIVAYYSSPYFGIIAFLSNFLREQLTIILVPFIKGSNVSLISLGGATTMDDTLPIYVAKLGKQYSMVSIMNGLGLTILVVIILPLIFYF